MGAYADFLASKISVVQSSGVAVDRDQVHPSRFEFQRDLIVWALRKGRAALFTATGTGKAGMALEFARLTGERALIFTPLGVTGQFVGEGRHLGIDVTIARSQVDVVGPISVTNYERLHLFDLSHFGCVVIDESSCLKDYESKTRAALTEACKDVPFRLACTATPSPNDIAELANHAEFLGIMNRTEMLATWFVHDETGWRLRGHAREPFYRWLASWAMTMKRPSDLGYSDDGYILPPLEIHPTIVQTDWIRPGQLFSTELKGITDRSAVRKATLADRVRAAIELVHAETCDNCGYERSRRPDVLPAVLPRESGETTHTIEGSDEVVYSGTESGPQGIHGRLSLEASGEVEADAGTTGTDQRQETGRLCGAAGRARALPGKRQGMASEQPGEAQGPETPPVRCNDADLRGTTGASKRAVCDLRPLGHEQSEDIPGSGSLPHNGDSSGPTLCSLQSGAGAFQGRSDPTQQGHRIPAEEQWILWVGRNDEQDALAKALGDECVSIDGRTPPDERLRLHQLWITGQRRILISKSAVFGFGMNWQHCANMAFVGLSDSFETYHQSIRRCWRYGQRRTVHAYVVLSEPEEAIYANVKRKEREFEQMTDELVQRVAIHERAEIGHAARVSETDHGQPMVLPAWLQGVA